MNHGRVLGINRSPGGIPKNPVAEAVVTASGIEGDWQRDRRNHGGPDRALCLYSLERLAALQAEGHPIHPGAIGENLTLDGLEWGEVRPGVALAIGETVRIEVTSYANPCPALVPYFTAGGFDRVAQKSNPGWSRVYARVRSGGVVRIGDRVEIPGA